MWVRNLEPQDVDEAIKIILTQEINPAKSTEAAGQIHQMLVQGLMAWDKRDRDFPINQIPNARLEEWVNPKRKAAR